jgi:hypothetical protein
MSLFHTFEGFEALSISQAIRGSVWLFPAIEAVHLLALATLGGAILIVDLRLMGAGLIAQPVAQVERDARPWFLGALCVMLATGIPLGLSEAVKLYDKPAFWVKMTALSLALVFALAVRTRLVARVTSGRPAAWGMALVSLALWLTVALAGRWIGFS